MHIAVTRYKAYTRDTIHTLPQYQTLSPELQFDIQVVSAVLPFRVNPYVVNELIDWRHVPDDPMYQLTFPQKGMLTSRDYAAVADLIKKNAPREKLQSVVNQIRLRLNPHPAGQIQYNVPVMDDESIPGVQHKYHETVLFFPSAGQTCHAYCSYCFRWAQFVGMEDLKFAAKEAGQLAEYLKRHPEVTDVLFTGGDPAIMKTRVMERYIEPLLSP
ncbi:MAG: lysine 2,3-aminomutase, partial [Anaerolineae bacterium]|nr:lysine 2,3-aminomutase [Anaerolineae bacterium]